MAIYGDLMGCNGNLMGSSGLFSGIYWKFNGIYPLVIEQVAIEHGHLSLIYP
jgi:hypothetical protein